MKRSFLNLSLFNISFKRFEKHFTGSNRIVPTFYDWFSKHCWIIQLQYIKLKKNDNWNRLESFFFARFSMSSMCFFICKMKIKRNSRRFKIVTRRVILLKPSFRSWRRFNNIKFLIFFFNWGLFLPMQF